MYKNAIVVSLVADGSLPKGCRTFQAYAVLLTRNLLAGAILVRNNLSAMLLAFTRG